MGQDQNATFLVLLDAGDGPAEYQVTAAYVSIDERLFPGWTLLKDEDGAIVAKVRSERALMIRRADSDPTLRRVAGRAPQPVRPQVQVQVTGGPPSPAQMAVLAGRLGAAVQRGTV